MNSGKYVFYGLMDKIQAKKLPLQRF